MEEGVKQTSETSYTNLDVNTKEKKTHTGVFGIDRCWNSRFYSVCRIVSLISRLVLLDLTEAIDILSPKCGYIKETNRNHSTLICSTINNCN